MSLTPLTVPEARAIVRADEALDATFSAREASGTTLSADETDAWIHLVKSARSRIAAYGGSSTPAVKQTATERGDVTAERDAYRAMLCDLLASAHPHPVEHPTMSKQWARAKELLRTGEAVAAAAAPAATKEEFVITPYPGGNEPDFQTLFMEAVASRRDDEARAGYTLKRLTTADAVELAELLRVSIDDKHWQAWHPRLREIRDRMIVRLGDSA